MSSEYNMTYTYKGFEFNIRVVLLSTPKTDEKVGLHTIYITSDCGIEAIRTILEYELIKTLNDIKKGLKKAVNVKIAEMNDHDILTHLVLNNFIW